MIGQAPGKLVLSGSYSVLWGAPSIVTAVGRFAIADSARPPVHIADEVRVAVERALIPAPCFVDASQLRADLGSGTSRKLGLGSSAAILLATLVAFHGAPTDDPAREALFRSALDAHRAAQGGGSGLDVAASSFGGTLSFHLDGAKTAPIALPRDLLVTVFAARTSAITASFVAKVRSFAAANPGVADPLLKKAEEGARAALAATDAETFARAITTQRDALATLGDHAGVPIVTPEVAALAKIAADRASFAPSGAGGGDVAFYAADHEPSAAFVERAAALGYDRLVCPIGALGARAVGQ